ncbi:MAG: DJ-1/PfpI family protein [Erysipelotrichaceae bacterium]|nr:DJ-1/PfpI family protein [Erysipelotrichaceae bacterium]
MRVLCLLADGFEECEAIAPIDLLRRAGVEVVTSGLRNREVKGSHGIDVLADAVLDEVSSQDFDCLMLPGGKGHKNFLADERVMDLIRRYHDEDRYLAAICASPTILGDLGYLKGKNYTCFEPMNRDFGGNYTGRYAEVDGKLITGKSMAAAIDFGLAVVETLTSPARRWDSMKAILYEIKEEELNAFDQKPVRITDYLDNVLEGVCQYESSEYCEAEYGGEEAALKINGWLVYLSDIKKIEIIEGKDLEDFAAGYGTIEEEIVDEGEEEIWYQVLDNYDLSVIRILNCLQARGLISQPWCRKILERLTADCEEEAVRKKAAELLNE